jgi:hypothetical protein
VDRVGGLEEGLGERGPELIGCKIVAKCVLVPALVVCFRWMDGQGTFNSVSTTGPDSAETPREHVARVARQPFHRHN